MMQRLMAFDLPMMNAVMNGLSCFFLVAGWLLIRSNRTRPHIVMMSCALVTSTVFLAGYITNHVLHGIQYFMGQGMVRPVYFTLLTSHTILAVATLPMVICTVTPALQARYDKHRRIARWTLPVWLYVSVTGVLVYFMLYRWYPQKG